MNKKVYIAPSVIEFQVAVENIIAASIAVDNTPGDGLEGNAIGNNEWNIWDN